jgi:dolichyl-phosphate-mannose--protein O-mannosyl transferase
MAIHVCILVHISSILDVCCNVSSECCKSRSGVAHVAMAIRACLKCFIYFKRMLQVFYLDDSKVDLERANIAMAVAAGGQRLATSACCC